ncbi:MAG TPA: hypothetical protein VD866_04005 [Urbifossiella sp.]|nr:hypothetical protein [Urbifossiella sp.]
MTGPKLRLAVASLLLLGWLGWLVYTAWAKHRGPVVSRSQAAAATLAVVARVPGGEGSQVVEVTEVLTGAKPDGPLTVANLSDAIGYDGPGEYLLLLAKVRADTYGVVGQLRAPGYDGVGAPTVYRWTPAVRTQAEARFR